MLKNNHHNFKILNNKLPLINLLFLLTIIYLGTIVDNWYFLFLILVVLSSIMIRPNKYQIIIVFSLIFIYLPIILFLPNFSLFSKFAEWFKADFVRNKIFTFFDKYYKKEISDFIKLILFGVKTNNTYYFYKQVANLGIVWLLSIGGFHIAFLSRIIKKIFKRKQKAGWIINLVVISIYSYLLKFNYSSLRILFSLILLPLFKRINLDRFNKIGFIGLIFCLLNPVCLQSYSFLLSFLCVIAAGFILELNLNNKLLTSVLISIFCFIVTIPFVTAINNKISLFTFINSFIFSYVFGAQFIYFLIFAWMPFMQIIHTGILMGTYALVGNISFFNIFLYFPQWKVYGLFLFYLIIYIIKKLLYLIVFNNKI